MEEDDPEPEPDPEREAQEGMLECLHAGRGSAAHWVNQPATSNQPATAQPYSSYDDPDTPNQLSSFHPLHQPGLHRHAQVTRGTMSHRFAIQFIISLPILPSLVFLVLLFAYKLTK